MPGAAVNGKEQATPGFYGKLPGLGDFVSRRLPVDFTQPWDLWLRESLASSQAQMGDDWLSAYLT
ncbi:type VI secretion system-associated protein TagF, partial [Thiorhodococcus mannitoliphagus]|uniref:type VI secretion system-associated protein TagF n=1 Tax=Thiorhodococcus mannitoliphagus TaxID=329406 RepID=UPI0030B88382